MGKRVIVTRRGVFETLEEAAAALGVATVTVSRMIKDSRDGIRYAERVFALHLRSGEWTLAVKASNNRGYIPMNEMGRKIPCRDVLEWRDMTFCWYFGDKG